MCGLSIGGAAAELEGNQGQLKKETSLGPSAFIELPFSARVFLSKIHTHTKLSREANYHWEDRFQV